MSTHNGPRSTSPPSWGDVTNGGATAHDQSHNGGGNASLSPPSGFVAVNSRQPTLGDSNEGPADSHLLFPHGNTDNVTIINGTSIKGASPTTRAELMKKFFTTADRNARGWAADDDARRSPGSLPRPASSSRPKTKSAESSDYAGLYLNSPSTSAVPIPSTPSSLLPHLKPTQAEKDDGGPYKAEMVGRMEQLHRGERVLPPCDRCRRLHMDCLKNLTACQGCTKKHAKCSWKEVSEEELRAGRHEASGTDHDDDLHDDDQLRDTPEHEPPRDTSGPDRPNTVTTETESELEGPAAPMSTTESFVRHPAEGDLGSRQQTNGAANEHEKEAKTSQESQFSRIEYVERRDMEAADQADDDADAAIAKAIATVSPPAASIS
jgi:hypothetical protein